MPSMAQINLIPTRPQKRLRAFPPPKDLSPKALLKKRALLPVNPSFRVSCPHSSPARSPRNPESGRLVALRFMSDGNFFTGSG